MTVEALTAAVHRAISKHDGTDIAAVYAVMAAHRAMRRSSGDASTFSPEIAPSTATKS